MIGVTKKEGVVRVGSGLTVHSVTSTLVYHTSLPSLSNVLDSVPMTQFYIICHSTAMCGVV